MQNQNNKIVLVDMDGPLADLEHAFLARWRADFPKEFFVPFEERKEFFLNNDYPEHLRKAVSDVLATAGFFADLPPVPGSVDAVHAMVDAGFTVILCTSDIYRNPTGLRDKRMWAERHLGLSFAKSMMFARDKTLVRGDYLIDDRPELSGLLVPAWKHVIFDQPFNWNAADQARIRVDWSNWKEVII